MWYEDLAPCTYFGEPADRLLAVGWLERGRLYTRGPVEPAFVDALADFLAPAPPRDPLQNPIYWSALPIFHGSHTCGLCPKAVGRHRPMGYHNHLVPGDGCVYVVPELIGHYVAAHGYAPPAPFRVALLACPPRESPAYWQAVKALAPGLVVEATVVQFATEYEAEGSPPWVHHQQAEGNGPRRWLTALLARLARMRLPGRGSRPGSPHTGTAWLADRLSRVLGRLRADDAVRIVHLVAANRFVLNNGMSGPCVGEQGLVVGLGRPRPDEPWIYVEGRGPDPDTFWLATFLPEEVERVQAPRLSDRGGHDDAAAPAI